MPYKIGLTGGIGSGKSTATNAFKKLGVLCLSADTIGHELCAQGEPAYVEIVKLFGKDVLVADGALDRAAIGAIVFNNSLMKQRLENILHPRIMRRMHQLADDYTGPYCVLDIPLLINTNQQDSVDRILVVCCKLEIRIQRIKLRNGWNDKKIEAVMAAQQPQEVLIEAADDLIYNNGSLEEIDTQVSQLHLKYSKLSALNT